MDSKLLSRLIDEARQMEEHYREGLLYWKSRRQDLESQIPIDNPFKDFIEDEMSIKDDTQ